jgi:hypothetical protein
LGDIAKPERIIEIMPVREPASITADPEPNPVPAEPQPAELGHE